MAQPTMNFDQALPYLRRGFILRIHGGDGLQGKQLRENQGKLELGGGDGAWSDAGKVPLLELAFDVYDQKKAEPFDPTKPLVETSELAKDVTAREAAAKAGSELDANTQGEQPDALSDEELRMDALRILREGGVEDPTDEDVNDMVGQLKAKAFAQDPVTDEGGNHPALPDVDGVPVPTGFNEAQTEQADEHEIEGDLGDVPGEDTHVEGEPSEGGRRRKKKH